MAGMTRCPKATAIVKIDPPELETSALTTSELVDPRTHIEDAFLRVQSL